MCWMPAETASAVQTVAAVSMPSIPPIGILPERLESWRTAWCNAVNAKFEEKGIPSRIDHRSYARQSVEQIPTVHEGPNVRKLEQKGIRTEKGELNRWIRSTNRLTRTLKTQIARLTEWIHALRSEPEASKTPTLWELVSEAQQRRYAQAWSQKGKVRDLKQFAEPSIFCKPINFSPLKTFPLNSPKPVLPFIS